MSNTDVPSTGNNIVWPTGTNETVLHVAAGQSKRVSTDNQVSARDINSIRSVIESLAVHTHEYTDAVGGC